MSWFDFGKSQTAGPPTAEEVRKQLAAMMVSHRFRRTGVQKDLLRYLVEHALDADSEALQEKAIASAVFARNESFDPSTDGVVRVVAERLRKSLDGYYARRRRRARIRIDLPRGSYTPVFARRTPGAFARRMVLSTALAIVLGLAYLGADRYVLPKPKPKEYHSVAILPFQNLNEYSGADPYVSALVAEVAERLSRYDTLRVNGRAPDEFRGEPKDPPAVARRLSVDALLEGGVYLHDGSVRVSLALLDGENGRPLWWDVYDQPENLRSTMLGDIAYAVATALGATERR